MLYLRAFVACANGEVFVNDPASRSNVPTVVATAAETVLTRWKQTVMLPGLTAPSTGSNQALAGEFVRVTDTDLPTAPPPTEPVGTNFNYEVRTDNFSAVNAYYHCDRLFRMMQGMGFVIRGSSGYFNGTNFPVSVDHRAIVLGDEVNSAFYADAEGDGIGRFAFGRCVSGTTVGMCTEFQTVAHEFGHAILQDSVHAGNFGFCHSAGDSLGVILADPYSILTDRFLTFPWCPITGPGERRHNRSVASGYAWGGTLDDRDYGSEQILSTTLFRVYQVTGGDSVHSNAAVRLATKERAARYMAYLIFRSIGSLATSPITVTPNAGVYETALINADVATMSFDGFPGGTHQKIIRWSFEKQGWHQPSGAPTPVSTAGAPPPVDVYIDDGRAGEYAPYLENFWETTEIWNLTSANPATVPTESYHSHCGGS